MEKNTNFHLMTVQIAQDCAFSGVFMVFVAFYAGCDALFICTVFLLRELLFSPRARRYRDST